MPGVIFYFGRAKSDFGIESPGRPDKSILRTFALLMKQFTIPFTYRSSLLGSIKNKRKQEDKMKKDFSPYMLDFGGVRIFLARHFGFCYGVENAIEIAFRTVEENKGKRIFLLSEMIHNPMVNEDLKKAGVRFLQDTGGKQIIPFEELTKADIVLIPAFGTTIETEQRLRHAGIAIEKYDTTCPFVEKVWNRSNQIGAQKYTVVIHGKPQHEETRATFSHASLTGPAIIVKDMKEAEHLGAYILGEISRDKFDELFSGRMTEGFNPAADLERIGVVNQTTMLAGDTQAIADYLKNIMLRKYSLDEPSLSSRFADTHDTLCYATNDNQTAVYKLLETPADLAIIVGGYNSSNTSHLVELCEEKLPSFFISSAEKILSETEIIHFDLHEKKEISTKAFLPEKDIVDILLTSGASCPDSVVEKAIERIISLRKTKKSMADILAALS